MTAGDAAPGKALPPSSGFSGDDGSADPELAATLAAHQAGRAPLADVVRGLGRSRVLVPILAELESSGEGEHGHTVDKEASAGVVALQAPVGRCRSSRPWRRWRRGAPTRGPSPWTRAAPRSRR